MAEKRGRFGILVGGGPAPGINSTIAAAAIEAFNSGCQVYGIEDGFEYLVQGRTDMVRELRLDELTRIHSTGGSILGTARANPTKPEDMARTLAALHTLGIDYLVTIGGDDTAYAASQIAKAGHGTPRVAHVPKTIDNDLPIPAGNSTFGFQTARHVGTEMVMTMMEDSRTTNRWFVVVVMGRKAGHLALGIGKAAGATLTIIPEEFPGERITIDDVAAVIDASIIKRRTQGRTYGLAVVAEGIGEKLDPEELAKLAGAQIAYDPYGHISLADLPLGALIKQRLQQRYIDRGDKVGVVEVTLGYELRCAPPIPFDIDYTRTLGYGAVRYLLGEHSDPRVRDAGFICLEAGHLQVQSFDDLIDPVTGKIRVRLVDMESDHYRVSRDYMIRLEAEDLEDSDKLARLADAASMSSAEFRNAFGRITSAGARPSANSRARVAASH